MIHQAREIDQSVPYPHLRPWGPKQESTGEIGPRRIDYSPAHEGRGNPGIYMLAENESLFEPAPQHVAALAVQEDPVEETLHEVGDTQGGQAGDQQRLESSRDRPLGIVAKVSQMSGITLKHRK